MAINQFKAFASGGSANVTSQADWEALPAILDGFQSGKASSAQVNKALRQATFIAAALAQYISDKNSADVLDDGDIAAFTASLSSALGKDYQALNANLTALAGLTGAADRLPYFSGANALSLATLTSAGRSLVGQSSIANMLSYLTAAPLASPTFTGDPKAPTPAAGDNDTSIATTAFVAAAVAALSLGNASQRTVGTATNQIPDMNSFTSSLGTTGWEKLPSGKIRQWGKVAAATGDTRYPVTFPIPFPSAIYSIQVSFGYTGAFVNIAVFAEATNPTITGFDANRQDAGSVFSVPTGFIFWEAIGS